MTKTTAVRVIPESGLVLEVQTYQGLITPTRVETMQYSTLIMESGTLEPWDTYLSSDRDNAGVE